MDWSLFRTVNRLSVHTHWAHPLFKAYANYGVGVFAVLIAIAGLLALRRSDARVLTRTVWAAGGALIALGLNQPIASLVDRARPYATHPRALVLVDKTTDPSFMSDHSIVAAAVAIGLFLAVRRIGIVAIACALAMAFTRVYVGAHYPGDAAAGLLFGAAVVIAGAPLADRWVTPIVERLLGGAVGRRFATPS